LRWLKPSRLLFAMTTFLSLNKPRVELNPKLLKIALKTDSAIPKRVSPVGQMSAPVWALFFISVSSKPRSRFKTECLNCGNAPCLLMPLLRTIPHIWQRTPSKNSGMPNKSSCQPRQLPATIGVPSKRGARTLFRGAPFQAVAIPPAFVPAVAVFRENLHEHTLHSYPRRLSIRISLRSADLAARGFSISAFNSVMPFWKGSFRTATLQGCAQAVNKSVP